MIVTSRRISAIGATIALGTFLASASYAQTAPQPLPPPPAPAPASPPAAVVTSPAPAPAENAPPPPPVVMATGPIPRATTIEDDRPDHERWVGHLGITYFGISQIPIATGLATTSATSSEPLSAPVIGVRYWFKHSIGLDLGLGFGYSAGGYDVSSSGMTTSTSSPGSFAFAVHGGLPLVFAQGKHYTFEAIPEVTVGFATGSQSGMMGAPNISLTGSRIEIGGRIGAEVNFGFIGLPELALQASVGVDIERTAWKASQGSSNSSQSAFAISTTVNGDPWDIFSKSIAAIYYF